MKERVALATLGDLALRLDGGATIEARESSMLSLFDAVSSTMRITDDDS